MTDFDLRLLLLRPAGMFSNVNEVIEQLRLAEARGYRFAIEWARSCYLDPDRDGDPWNYYFEPVFDDLPFGALDGQDPEVLLGGGPVACSQVNIITPRIEEGKCNSLLLPRDRKGANDLIRRYLRLVPELAEHIDAFASAHFKGPVIGLHVRGPGRLDGGSSQMRKEHFADGRVPFDIYFGQVDRVLKDHPDARIFVCSDSSMVIQEVTARYGDRVLTYGATRSTFGEMHANHPENEGQVFPPHKLGHDVLSEAYLLSRVDVLVHGNSNVANFVLCNAPDLPHHYVLA